MSQERNPVVVTTPAPSGGTNSQVIGFVQVPRQGDLLRVGSNVWSVVQVIWLTGKESFDPIAEVILSPLAQPAQPSATQAAADRTEDEPEVKPNRKTRRQSKAANTN